MKRDRLLEQKKNNESEKQLQVAPVMEQEDQGGGLERTKAEYYAAVIKSGLACLLQRCCPVAPAAMYSRDAHSLCFLTRTWVIESELWTLMRD